jgi:hypothetical protein
MADTEGVVWPALRFARVTSAELFAEVTGSAAKAKTAAVRENARTNKK